MEADLNRVVVFFGILLIDDPGSSSIRLIKAL